MATCIDRIVYDICYQLKGLRADCCRLGFKAGIYHVWAQRDFIKHQGTVRTEDQTLGVIKNQVKIKIKSKGVHPNSSMNKKTCTKWGISNVVFKPKV